MNRSSVVLYRTAVIWSYNLYRGQIKVISLLMLGMIVLVVYLWWYHRADVIILGDSLYAEIAAQRAQKRGRRVVRLVHRPLIKSEFVVSVEEGGRSTFPLLGPLRPAVPTPYYISLMTEEEITTVAHHLGTSPEEIFKYQEEFSASLTPSSGRPIIARSSLLQGLETLNLGHLSKPSLLVPISLEHHFSPEKDRSPRIVKLPLTCVPEIFTTEVGGAVLTGCSLPYLAPRIIQGDSSLGEMGPGFLWGTVRCKLPEDSLSPPHRTLCVLREGVVTLDKINGSLTVGGVVPVLQKNEVGEMVSVTRDSWYGDFVKQLEGVRNPSESSEESSGVSETPVVEEFPFFQVPAQPFFLDKHQRHVSVHPFHLPVVLDVISEITAVTGWFLEKA